MFVIGTSIVLKWKWWIIITWNNGVVDGQSFVSTCRNATTYVVIGIDSIRMCQNQDSINVMVNALPTEVLAKH
ncbi:MAG: hypothetical protein R2772_05575 [Chitinophagales bacterium]